MPVVRIDIENPSLEKLLCSAWKSLNSELQFNCFGRIFPDISDGCVSVPFDNDIYLLPDICLFLFASSMLNQLTHLPQKYGFARSFSIWNRVVEKRARGSCKKNQVKGDR